MTKAGGDAAEDRACRELTAAGLQLLERNYRCRLGEIDLIMREGEALVFVEVRLRRNTGYADAAESVGVRKRRRLINAARHYLMRQGTVPPCRFDVVALDARGELNWIKSAFDAD